jgi:hypothetical protein
MFSLPFTPILDGIFVIPDYFFLTYHCFLFILYIYWIKKKQGQWKFSIAPTPPFLQDTARRWNKRREHSVETMRI